MGGFFWEPHHANHDPPSRMVSDVSRFVGRAACMDADGCLHKSTDIPAVLFSPQWVFAQNPVEQQTTELPYKFRGNKISSWGRSSPVGAPKEKSGTFSFLQKAFSKSVVCSQRKSGTFSFYKRKELSPVGRHRKEPPQIPSAGICVNLTSGCHLFSKISNAFFRCSLDTFSML